MNRLPVGDLSQRAALAALRSALSAIRCAATMLVTGASQDRDRGLGVAILHALNAAEQAVRRLNVGVGPGRATDPGLN